MTDYIIEYFKKGARTPYDCDKGTLPHGAHPTYIESQDCFQGGIKPCPGKIRIRFASNRGLAAESYTDSNGARRLKWFRR